MPKIARVQAFAIRSDLFSPGATPPRRAAWTAHAEVAGPMSRHARWGEVVRVSGARAE